jgi:endo-1,4-beta-xylanase
MQNWITAIVGRYAGKVKAWDVVNEAFDDNGNIRSGTSTNDIFYWGAVLGSVYIENAFKYARAADPNALLFINDYNLELNNSKLDAFVATANDLKTRSIPIDGVATQMHISINTSNANIDAMFQKLAATGLKVHVSELDIRINPSGTTPFTPTGDLYNQQAAKYRYVAESYIKYVPAAQRYGITVWNVSDSDTWISNDFPTLFGAGYTKKPAFQQFLQGLD